MNIKNISLTTLALSAAIFAANSQAADASATATAEVITPIAVANAANLSFGKFARGAGGSVTISTSGARTASGTILSAVGSSPTAARFDVTGDGVSSYSIAWVGTSTVLTHTNTVDTMAFAPCSALTSANSCSGNVSAGALTAGAQSIYAGGALTVGASQLTGAYSGTIAVQVEYN